MKNIGTDINYPKALFPKSFNKSMADEIRASQRSELIREIREFLKNSSVWDSDYIYLRKANLLTKFDEKFLDQMEEE